MATRTRWLSRTWGSLHEPKRVTALVVIVYAVTLILGVSIFQNITVQGVSIFTAVKVTAGVAMVTGGATGVPAAWVGAYWLERLSAIALAGGYTLWGIFIAYLHFSHPSFGLEAPWTTLTATAVVALFALIRFERVKQAPYAAGKGPLLPEVQARQEALTETIPD